MFQVGTILEIDYPVSNRIGAKTEFTRRSIRIDRVRDLLEDPLSVEEYLRRPFVRRSRWLVAGLDRRLGFRRCFYLGSSRQLWTESGLRVGLYEPGMSRPFWIIGPLFRPTMEDQQALCKSLQVWKECDMGELQMRIYCDDLKVYS